jgi:hypothetical protein
MRLNVNAVQLGMAAGLVTAVACVISEIERSETITAITLLACLAGGTLSITIWGQALPERCDRYEKALRQLGIDPNGLY